MYAFYHIIKANAIIIEINVRIIIRKIKFIKNAYNPAYLTKKLLLL